MTPDRTASPPAVARRSLSRALAELSAAVGREHVLVSDAEVEPYRRDATPLFAGEPDAVVLPATTAEVAAVLAVAARHRLPVVPRGAGTNLAAATVPLTGGIVLVLTRMDAVLEIAPAELLARVQPGVVTADLGAAVAGHGLMFVPDPASAATSTIGGNIATSAGGLRGLKHGTTKDHVLGLEAVLATGQVLRTGGRLAKDVAGYDLTRLLVGSEGTLAVITEATLALRPVPEATGTGLACFPALEDAGRAVAAIVAAGILPGTLELLDSTCIRAVEAHAGLGLDTGAGALLLFGDDGHPAAVEHHLSAMAAACRAAGATDTQVATDAASADALLAARRCALPALAALAPTWILGDVAVPRPQLATMVAAIQRIAAQHDVVIATFGHAGDGNLHPTCLIDDGDPLGAARSQAAFAEVYARALDLGGTITGEHGIGAAKRPYLQDRLGADQIALLRRVKAAFDPLGLLNPGKLGS